ncbi:MAG: hypothetical protein H7839_19855 [Magnetococcus sp. YQC-5]
MKKFTAGFFAISFLLLGIFFILRDIDFIQDWMEQNWIESSEKDKTDLMPRVFHWSDSNNHAMVTIHAQGNVDPTDYFINDKEIIFTRSEILPPIPTPNSFTAHTFQVRKVTNISKSLFGLKNKPVVHLVGETHLGKDQIHVAKIILSLINNREIDAILLEQPETLKFDWSRYKSLENSPDKTIAALQSLMLADAAESEKTELNLGNYQKYFNNITNQKSLDDAIKNLFKEHGETEGLKALETLSKEIERIEDLNNKNNSVEKRYKESRYFSAADYLYIMLNLKKIKIPFFAIENINARQQFEENMNKQDNPFEDADLLNRDISMSANTVRKIKENGYSQVILLCGAMHLNNLTHLLTEAGLDPIVAHNSMKVEHNFKPSMMVSYPERIIQAVEHAPNRIPDSSLMPNNSMSSQVTKAISAALTQSGMNFSPTELRDMQKQFDQQYRDRNLKGVNYSWEMQLDAGNSKSIILSKDALSHSFSLEISQPLDASEQQRLISKSRKVVHTALDQTNIQRLNNLNNSDGQYRVVTVEPFTTSDGIAGHYMAHDDRGNFFTADSPKKLVKMLTKESNTSKPFELLFFDMKGFDSNRTAAFKHSLDSINTQNQNWQVKALERGQDGNTRLQDSILRLKVPIEKNSIQFKEITQITEGQYKGWFDTGFRRLIQGTLNLTIAIITKTHEQAVLIRKSLTEITHPKNIQNNLINLDLPSLTILAIQEMRKHGFNVSDFKLQLLNETGDIIYTENVYVFRKKG